MSDGRVHVVKTMHAAINEVAVIPSKAKADYEGLAGHLVSYKPLFLVFLSGATIADSITISVALMGTRMLCPPSRSTISVGSDERQKDSICGFRYRVALGVKCLRFVCISAPSGISTSFYIHVATVLLVISVWDVASSEACRRTRT